MQHIFDGQLWAEFDEIIEKPICYLVAAAKGDEEANEAKRIVAFTAYGPIITATDNQSIATAKHFGGWIDMQQYPDMWQYTFEQYKGSIPAAVLIAPTEIINKLSGLKVDTGSVVGVFHRNHALVFEAFN